MTSDLIKKEDQTEEREERVAKRTLEEIKSNPDVPTSDSNNPEKEENDESTQPTKIRKVEEDAKEADLYAKKSIRIPYANDVLCGRGGGTNNHAGNENFRVLVTRKKREYLNSSKREKPLVSKSIVEEIRNMNPPGRFLQRNDITNLWFDIGDQKAREKTSQALREGAPEIRKELGVEGAKAKLDLHGLNRVSPGANPNGLLVGMRGAPMQWSEMHGLPMARHGPAMTRDLAVDILHRDHDHAMRRILPQYLTSHVRQQHAIRLSESKPYQGLNRLENPAVGPWSPSQQGQGSSQIHVVHHQHQFPIQMRQHQSHLSAMHANPLTRMSPKSQQLSAMNGSQRSYAQVHEFPTINSLPPVPSSNLAESQPKYWQRHQTHPLVSNSTVNEPELTLKAPTKCYEHTNLLEKQNIEATKRSPPSNSSPNMTSKPATGGDMKVEPLSKDVEFRLTVNDYLTRVSADGQHHKTKDLQMEAKLYQEAGLLGLDPEEMLNEIKKGIAVQQLLALKLGDTQKNEQKANFDNSWATLATSQSRIISSDNSTQDSTSNDSKKRDNDFLKIQTANTVTQQRVVSALRSMGVSVLVESSVK